MTKNKARIKVKNKSKVQSRTKHQQKAKYVKILKKYQFQQDGAAPPADGAAPPAADGVAPPAEPPAEPPADGPAREAKEESKGEQAMAEAGTELTEEQKMELRQRESIKKQDDIKNMVREFKTLAEPTKIFTEGAMDLDKPHLVLENSDNIPEDYDKMDSTKECEYKEGYLGYITNIRLPDYAKIGIRSTSKYPIMTGVAVLAVLNKNSLSLFDKEHVNSLIRTFDIMHLTPKVYKDNFGDLQCFQLISIANSDSVALTKDEDTTFVDPSKVMATLCCSSFDKLMDWKDAIERFSHCKVEVAQDETKEVENTFSTVKNRIKVLRQRLKDDEKVNQEYTKTDNDQEALLVQKHVENMKKAVADEINQQNQEKRELTVKLENDIQKSVGATMQEECLEKALQIQQDEESRAVENMIQAESETREEEELKKQQDDLIKSLKEQGKNIALQEETLDESIKRMTKSMQYNMVQSVEQFERFASPEMCKLATYTFPPAVVSFPDKMHYICTQMIDPQSVDIETINDCMVPEYFCDVCCNYNIGPSDEIGREKCVQECSVNFNEGETNRFELVYILEVNPRRITAFISQQQDVTKSTKLKIFFEGIASSNKPDQMKGQKKKIAKQFGMSETEVEATAKATNVPLE